MQAQWGVRTLVKFKRKETQICWLSHSDTKNGLVLVQLGKLSDSLFPVHPSPTSLVLHENKLVPLIINLLYNSIFTWKINFSIWTCSKHYSYIVCRWLFLFCFLFVTTKTLDFFPETNNCSPLISSRVTWDTRPALDVLDTFSSWNKPRLQNQLLQLPRRVHHCFGVRKKTAEHWHRRCARKWELLGILVVCFLY